MLVTVISLQVDVHVGGELVESLSEAGPDTPEQEAPPTSAEDEPDTGTTRRDETRQESLSRLWRSFGRFSGALKVLSS